MSIDEILRVASYTVIIPGCAYIGVKVWNSVVMPARLCKPVAIFLWLQSAIYVLFTVGLFLLRLFRPVPFVLALNTMIIGLQAATIFYVVVQASQLNKVKVIILAALGLALFMLGR